jgi:uncharacterized membrane protein
MDIVVVLGLLCVTMGIVVVAVLPIVLLMQFSDIKNRLRTLEGEVRRLHESARASSSAEEPRVVELAPAIEEPRAVEREVAEVSPRSRGGLAEPHEADWAKLEAWLGLRGLGWAAVVLLLFTGAFFFKVLIERELIGELARIMIGVGLGIVLSVAGWLCHRRGKTVFCQMLTSGGIALLYLSTFATFGFYHLLTRQHAAPFLIVLVAEAFTLAALYRAPAIAIMAVVGGLLNPILLDTGEDRYRELFLYLVILNAGVTLVGLFRRWHAVTTIALVGTEGLFWSWYTASYHPAKLDACLLFHGAIFILYLGQMMVVHLWQKQRANVEDLLRLLLITGFTAGAGYWLLDPEYHEWMGSFAVGLAIVYAVLAWMVDRRRAEDEPLLLSLLALALALVATVFPLEAKAAWIAVGWAAQGLALWWFGLRVRDPRLYGFGALFLVLALGRLLISDTLAKPPHVDPFVPIFNRYGLPGTIVAFSLIAAALLQRRTHPESMSGDFILMRIMGMAGVVTLWIVLSIETHDFFVVRANLDSSGVQALLTQEERELPKQELRQRFAEYAEDMRLSAQMALSALWSVFALVAVAAGLRLQHRPLRWLGLGLFALTLIKVMLVDTSRLKDFYRVGAFFALSLMMAAGAWVYQKLRNRLTAETGVDHGPKD